jgi:AcrR family transcriptional regulator
MPALDRRIQKTRKLLSESLIALILEKGYERVTIQDIIDKANVGRSTFYTHYENKEQLLVEGHRNLGLFLFQDEASAGSKPESDGEGPDFLPLFRHAGESLPLAKAMLGKKSGDIFTAHLRNQIAEMIAERFKPRFGKAKQDRTWLKYLSAAAAAAVMSLLISWLEDDVPFSSGEMAGKCRRAVTGMFTGFRPRAQD